jgi:hypothetical protein
MPSVLMIVRSLLRHHAPRRVASAASVSIHVRNVAQVFNSLDPSPFWDRDHDREAAEFIEEEFSEKLSAHICMSTPLRALLWGRTCRRQSSTTMSGWRPRRAIGCAIRCGSGGILTGLLHGGAPRMLDEGLIILAWLALWRPAESLVYGWVPPYRKRRLYERLTAVRVSVRTEPPDIEAAHTERASPAVSARATP